MLINVLKESAMNVEIGTWRKSERRLGKDFGNARGYFVCFLSAIRVLHFFPAFFIMAVD